MADDLPKIFGPMPELGFLLEPRLYGPRDELAFHLWALQHGITAYKFVRYCGPLKLINEHEDGDLVAMYHVISEEDIPPRETLSVVNDKGIWGQREVETVTTLNWPPCYDIRWYETGIREEKTVIFEHDRDAVLFKLFWP